MMWRLWRPVEGTTYEVSDAGEVRNARGHILKAGRASHGYMSICLTHVGESRRRTHCVHDLVLRAFRGPPPEGHEGDHADRDRSNNALSNLSWKLRGVNRSHKGEECGTAVLNEEKVLGLRRMAASGQFTHTELAAEFGISITQVGKIIHRRNWRHV